VTAPLKLICLKAPAPQFDPAKGSEGLPQRILVMPWGDNATADGQVIVNETTLKQLHAYNARKGWDRPALDFEHSSVLTSPTYRGEPAKVAGYGSFQIVEGEGIYMLMSAWTAEGKEYAGGGHYGDISPVVVCNDKHEVIGCHSVALCRHGATPGLTFLSAPHPSTMDPKPPQNDAELAAALKTTLGLKADATPADVISGLTEKLKAPAPAATEKPADKPEEGKGGNEEIKQLTATVTGLVKTVEGLTGLVTGNERAQVLAKARAEGKEVPKTAAEKMPLEELKILCAELPVTVPMEKRTPDQHTLMLSSSPPAAQPINDDIARHTGVTDDMRKKYAGA
jgi:phage I-like protein